MTERSLQKSVKHVLGLFDPCSVKCGKIRIGGGHDGGYVMANDFSKNKVAYSIGVGPQVLWDADMADRGLQVYQYDHTVDAVPDAHDNFHYSKLGIGADDMSNPQLITLEKMLADNGHLDHENMILKMDVEHAEWDVFLAMDVNLLKKFDQIVMEMHGFFDMHDNSFRTHAGIALKKLSKFHRCIHIHANNYSSFRIVAGVAVPETIEVTYCLKDKFEFLEEPDFFPTIYDLPCNPDAPDLYLGQFKFR